MGVRLSTVVLRVEGGDAAQQTLSATSKALANNALEMKKLEAEWGKGSKSMEYLTQRSDLLKARLAEQEKATAAMRDVREKYAASENANADQLSKLDTQIANAEIAEARLHRQIRECDQAIQDQTQAMEEQAQAQEDSAQAADKAAKAQKTLGDAAKDAGDQAKGARRQWEDMLSTLEEKGARVEKLGQTLTKSLTMPIIGMGAAIGKMAVDLEDALYEVATLPGVLTGTAAEQEQQLSAYKEAILAASNRAYTDADTLAAAQYQAISAGVSPEESVYWAERTAMAAKAGRSDADTVVNGASSVVNAWKESAGGLDHVLDVMLVTQNLGKTDVGQLSSQIGQVSGIAPQLGVSMEEVFAAVAAMTLGGSSTSSAITGLKAVLSGVIKPTSEAREEAKRLGLEFDAAAIQAKGLTGFLQDITDKTGMDVESLGKLFGSVEGLNEVLALGTSAADSYANALQEMQGANGVLDEAFSVRTSSRAEKLSGSLNKLKNSGIELAESLLPAVDMAADLLDGVAGAVDGMDASSQQMVVKLGLIAAAAGPATQAVGTLMTNAGKLFQLATNPWTWGAVGIGAVAYYIATLQSDAEVLQSKLTNIEASMSPEAAQNIASGIEAGIAAANKDYEIIAKATVSVDGETLRKDLQEAFDEALKDNEVSFSEYQALRAMILGELEPDAAAGLKDAATSGVARELLGAIDEMEELLKVVYEAGDTVTAQEISDLEDAIAKVKELHEEMNRLRSSIEGEGDSPDIVTQGEAGAVTAKGKGDEKTWAEAAAYTAQMEQHYNAAIDQALEGARQTYISDMAKAAAPEEEAAVEAVYTAAQEKAKQMQDAVSGSVSESLLAQWEGVLNAAGGDASAAAQEMQKFGAMLDVMSAVSYAIDHYQTADDLINRLPAGTLARAGYGQLEDGNGLADPAKIDLQTLLTSLEIDLQKLDVSTLGENPLMQLMQAWLDAGIDPSQLDTSGMDDTLAAALHVLMAAQDAESVGTEAMEALTLGVEEGGEAAEPRLEEQAAKLDNALALGNQTARGREAANQIRNGLTAATPGALRAASNLAAQIQAELAITLPGLGGGYAGTSGGVVSNSTDNSVNVTIQHASMEGEGQASTVADQIAAYSRMKNAGVGE